MSVKSDLKVINKRMKTISSYGNRFEWDPVEQIYFVPNPPPKRENEEFFFVDVDGAKYDGNGDFAGYDQDVIQLNKRRGDRNEC